jgi:hypothetical protein
VFIDDASGLLKNRDILERRMQGLVSYFRGHDPSLYPDVASVVIVRTAMSARQFSEYMVHRGKEIKREQSAKRFAAISGRADDDEMGSFRSLSRAVCNFAFPAEVPRPTRALLKAEAAATPSGPRRPSRQTQSTDEDTTLDSRYYAALDDAIERIQAIPGRLLLMGGDDKGGGLDELSPKYATVTRQLASQDEGTALVYSQFRRAEGVNLLAAALKANGFVELRIHLSSPGGTYELVEHPKHSRHSRHSKGSRHSRHSKGKQSNHKQPRFMQYSNDDPKVAGIMLALFNNQWDAVPSTILDQARALVGNGNNGNMRGELVRALLITSSGAEGITTRNVRTVHVLEPFWHANRVEQVIGRAVRAYSHDDLPEAERSVRVYIHIMTLKKEQAEVPIMKRDGGRTSDEHVHAVAQRKHAILSQLIDVMRAAAVDCRLNSARHAKAAATIAARRGLPAPDPPRCSVPPAGLGPGALVWSPDIQDDTQTDRSTARLVRVSAHGGVYYKDEATGTLYDAAALQERNELVQVRVQGAPHAATFSK